MSQEKNPTQPEDVDQIVGTELWEMPADEGDSEEAPKAKETETVTPEPKEELEPKNDPSRFEYWQSVADKNAKRLHELEPLAPVAKLFIEDPELVDEFGKLVEARKSKSTGPEKPVAPVKPEDFDEADSFATPGSPSWNFRKETEKYQTRLLEFYDQRENARQAAMKEQEARQRQLEKQREDEMKLRVELTSKGVPEGEHEAFIQSFSKPGTVKLDHLVELWSIVKGNKGKAAQKAADLERRKERADNPPPVGMGSGESDVPERVDEQEAFNNSLLSARKRK